MSTATYNQTTGSLRQYFSDLGNAARAFADALFAAQARQFVVQEVRAPAATATAAPAARVSAHYQLFALARDVEGFSPNFASELRTLASRD